MNQVMVIGRLTSKPELVVLNDGRQAILTVGLGDTLYKIEAVLF